MSQLLDIFLHVDKHLAAFTQEHGAWWVYGLIFGIIFLETGVVIMPFLPGDSLLFAAGALAASDEKPIDVWTVSVVIFVAAVIGDAVNYHVGKFIGPRVFRADGICPPGASWGRRMLAKAFKKQHLDRAHAFYEKHGGKAVIMARFVPIVRTFIPFVAGAGAMNYGRFIWFNVIGAFLWVLVCVGAGHVFGQTPFVKKNFELVIIGIIIVSVMPMVVQFVIEKYRSGAGPAGVKPTAESSN